MRVAVTCCPGAPSALCSLGVSTATGGPQHRGRESRVRVSTGRSRAALPARNRQDHGTQQASGWGSLLSMKLMQNSSKCDSKQ